VAFFVSYNQLTNTKLKILNMKKIILLTAISLSCLALAQKVGGDKDVHGCIGSAGYTYSQIKNTCVKVFEQKIKLNEVSSDKSYTSMTAVIFSKNMKKAEIFILDGAAKSIILTRKGKNKIWKSGSNIKESYVLARKKTGYQIKKDNVVIYQ